MGYTSHRATSEPPAIPLELGQHRSPEQAILAAVDLGYQAARWELPTAPQIPGIDRGYYCFHRKTERKYALCRVETHYEWVRVQ